MQEEQAKSLVSELFREAFDEDAFLAFIKQLLNHVDDSPERQTTLVGQMIRQAYRDRIKSCKRLCTYKGPEGARVDVLVIRLKSETTLERGRGMLRNFAADYLKNGHGNDKDAV